MAMVCYMVCYGIDGYVHDPLSSTILPVGNCRNNILGAWCGWEIPAAEPGFKWFEWEHVNYLLGFNGI